MYERCLAEDPRYAPAWARLGRIYRLMAKYVPEGADLSLQQAEAAFGRALEINPDLPLAHSLYAQFEAEAGRTRDAMVRLLERARGGSNDPDLFAGLVHVCRYCGLLEASLAADRNARRLDPRARTSVAYTHLLLGDNERAVATAADDPPFARGYGLAALGRTAEALAAYREMERVTQGPGRDIVISQRAALEGDRPACLAAGRRLLASSFRDPEGLYFLARTFAHIADVKEALPLLRSVVERGFFCYPALARDPWLDPVRAEPDFQPVLREAEARHREARQAFADAGGEPLLGLPSGT